MKSYLPFVIFGLSDGSIYGLAGMGLVLAYKTTGVLNFGFGVVAASAAFVFYSLNDVWHVPWAAAAAITMFGYGPAVGLILERLASGLSRVSAAAQVVGTVGLLIGLAELLQIIYGIQAKTLRPFLPQSSIVTIAGVAVTEEILITFGLGVGSAVALYAVFRWLRLGVAMRAVVDDPALLDITGEDPVRIRRLASVMSAVFASGSGILLALKLDVDPLLLGLLVLAAFGAATIGFFRSLPMTFVGGLVVGVAQDLTSRLIAGHSSLTGLDLNVPFLLLFLGLLFVPKRRLAAVGAPRPKKRSGSFRLRPAQRGSLGVGALGILLAIPYLVGTKLPVWVGAWPYGILFLSLALLVNLSGQVSLCQVGFAAVGAATFGHAVASGIPWLPALVLAGIVAIPVGMVVAIPAIRLSGIYLALATLGLGVLLNQFFYIRSYMFGAGGNLRTPRPRVIGLNHDRSFYYVLFALFVVAAFVVVTVERTRLGRLLRSLSDSPVALNTLGASTNVSRILVFSISAFIAGVAGALTGTITGVTNQETFPYFNSLVMLAVLAIAGRAMVPSALIAAFLLQVLPGYVTSSTFREWLQVLFGAAAIAAALLSEAIELPAWMRSLAAQSTKRKNPIMARLHQVEPALGLSRTAVDRSV